MKKITPNVPEFPKALTHIPAPPKELYIKGTLPDPKTHSYVCIVGSRNHTAYGKAVCEYLIEGLSGYPIVIVSGLAHGIDAHAHRYALAHNLKTVAFPGSGLDPRVLHPRAHASLAEKILDHGGALVSEFPPTTQGAQWTFPQRNRLMAGIADLIIIIEAKEKSGTKITARLGVEYGKEVVAIPGSIFSQHSKGTHTLIKEGALPISTPQEILEILGFHVRSSQHTLPLREFTDDEEKILHHCTQPMSRSELLRVCGNNHAHISGLLSKLEIEGYVREEDGMYVRVG